MVLLWKHYCLGDGVAMAQYCLGVSPGVVGFREGLAEQQVELGGVLQAGLPLVEAVSPDTIWKLFTVFGIMLPAYTHTHRHKPHIHKHTHTHTQPQPHTETHHTNTHTHTQSR